MPRVHCIFTAISTSLSLGWRQCGYRYAFRAGRNLPDKEFRYLRTVIVTAAVHWGFGSSREALPLTFQHWAGVSPYTSPYGLAETCVFGKQSMEPFHCGQLALAPLLPKLRGHFAEFLNEGSSDRLGILYLPTCVGLGYGHPVCSLEVFLGGMASTASPKAARHHVSGLMRSGFTWTSPHTLTPGTTIARVRLAFPVTPSLT